METDNSKMAKIRPVYCGNFEYDARQSEIERLFTAYGRVDRVDMKTGNLSSLVLGSQALLSFALVVVYYTLLSLVFGLCSNQLLFQPVLAEWGSSISFGVCPVFFSVSYHQIMVQMWLCFDKYIMLYIELPSLCFFPIIKTVPM